MSTNQNTSPHLLSHFELHGLALRNRVVMAPLTRARAGCERLPNDLMTEYYTQRASAGLIIAEATTISEQGFGWVDSPGIYNDAQVAGWKKVTAALHARAKSPAGLAVFGALTGISALAALFLGILLAG